MSETFENIKFLIEAFRDHSLIYVIAIALLCGAAEELIRRTIVGKLKAKFVWLGCIVVGVLFFIIGLWAYSNNQFFYAFLLLISGAMVMVVGVIEFFTGKLSRWRQERSNKSDD